jgi:hypothetical protein
VSANFSCYPASARDDILAAAAEQAMRDPKAIYRNPAKLDQARQILTRQHEWFVELFGADLIVVAGHQVPLCQAQVRHKGMKFPN